MSFGLNWTKRGSAVHCEVPYFKIVSKQNPTWWIKVKAPPWPLAQRPRVRDLIDTSFRMYPEKHLKKFARMTWMGEKLFNSNFTDRLSRFGELTPAHLRTLRLEAERLTSVAG